MRAYLSILLVPDPEGGGAEGVVAADNFPEVPMLLTVVLIRCSLDPNTCWVEADPTGTCRGTYPVLLGVEGRADGIAHSLRHHKQAVAACMYGFFPITFKGEPSCRNQMTLVYVV